MKAGKKRWASLLYQQKIRNVLLAYYLTPVLCILLMSGGFFYFFAKHGLDDELGKRLTSIALSASYQIYPFQISALELRDSQNLTYQSLLGRMDRIRNENQIAKVYVFNLKNESLLDTDRTLAIGAVYDRNRANRVELEQALHGQPTASVLFQGVDGTLYKSAFAPVVDSNGATLAMVGVDGSATFFRSLHLLGQRLALFGFVCIAIIIGVTMMISRKIVLPIRQLVAAAERIGGGHIESSVEIRSQNEIGFLGFVMDEMRKSILRRDREMQTMLRGIAHEVRNPLGGIELFAGMLSEEVQEPRSKQAVEKIKKEVRILKTLVEEFLDFAKKSTMQITSVTLEPFFNDLRLAFQTALEDRQVEFHYSTDGVTAGEFDPDQMRRVFLNLIRNALQAVPTGGRISIRCSRANGNLEITVADNGVGIQKENLDKVFDPFFTTKEGGSGLGLAFASKIVTAHAGEIRIESSVGTGTTIIVTLPE